MAQGPGESQTNLPSLHRQPPPRPRQRSPGFWPTRRSPSTWFRLRTTSTWQSPGAVQAPRVRSWHVRGEPRGRAVPPGGGWQAGTRPLGTAAAPAPGGEPPHDPPAAPRARRADRGPARHSQGGPPWLCFREPDPRRHFGEDRPRAPLRPRILLGVRGAGPPKRGPERSGRVTGGPREPLGSELEPSRQATRRKRPPPGQTARRVAAQGLRSGKVAALGPHRLPRGAPTHGLRAPGARAPRKFPPSAPTRVSGRGGAGPRHSCRHTKERGGCGWPRGARPDVNKPPGPLGEPSAGCGNGGAAPAR